MTIALMPFRYQLRNVRVLPRRCDADDCGQWPGETLRDDVGVVVQLCPSHANVVKARRGVHRQRFQRRSASPFWATATSTFNIRTTYH